MRGFLVTAAFLGVVLLVSFSAQFPVTASSGWLRVRQSMGVLWPQGWFFYAEAPRQSVPVLYRVKADGNAFELSTQAQGAARYWWGIRRTSSADMVEIMELYGAVPPAEWHSCGTDFVDCLHVVNDYSVAYALLNRSNYPAFCGRFIVAVESQAGRRGHQPIYALEQRVERAASVNITCAR